MTITATRLADRAGITYRQLDFWTRAGHITATPRPVFHGSGCPREYEDAEARTVVEMAHLVRAGLPPKVARHVAEELLTTGRAALGVYRLERVAP